MSADELFESVVEAFAGGPGISKSKMFGSPGLKVGGKVFAVLVNGRLVVKLPQVRVDAMVASGDGERFDPGMGRLMREWVAVAPGCPLGAHPAARTKWLSLAEDARDFVAALR